MVGSVVIHSVTGNIGPALSWREGKENVSPRSTVAAGEIVATAQVVIDFHQELIRAVALRRR